MKSALARSLVIQLTYLELYPTEYMRDQSRPRYCISRRCALQLAASLGAGSVGRCKRGFRHRRNRRTGCLRTSASFVLTSPLSMEPKISRIPSTMLSSVDSVEQRRAQEGSTGTSAENPTAPTAPRPAIRRKALPSAAANSDIASAAKSPVPPGAAISTVALGREDDGPIGGMLAGLPADIAASVAAEHPLFQEVRALALVASPARVEALCQNLAKSTAYHYSQQEAAGLMDLVGFLRDLKDLGPGVAFPVKSGDLRTAHYMAGSIIKTALLDENVKTSAQMLALEPPQGGPTNRSYFEIQPITFAYDAQSYQADLNYRHWVGERTLGMTDTRTLEAWHEELTQRFENRPRMGVPVDPDPGARFFDHDPEAEAFFGAMQRHNRLVNTMIQERNKGAWKANHRLGEESRRGGTGALHGARRTPQVARNAHRHRGEKRLPMMSRFTCRRPSASRWPGNWTTVEELFRFPLSLRAVQPQEFRQTRPSAPEILFTDRFGVTMLGVMQTTQCSTRNRT